MSFLALLGLQASVLTFCRASRVTSCAVVKRSICPGALMAGVEVRNYTFRTTCKAVRRDDNTGRPVDPRSMHNCTCGLNEIDYDFSRLLNKFSNALLPIHEPRQD